uniref:Amine oxidase n=1 Tax=Parastrongyloides trichosuri TaxID=131310 RepID=A0A0N4ZIG6_PARTI
MSNNICTSEYYNSLTSQFELPGYIHQDVYNQNKSREKTLAYNFVIISLPEVTFKMRHQLHLFDYFDEESGIRLVGYCIPIFVYRRYFAGRTPLHHKEIIRRKSGSPGNPHVSFLKYVKIPVISIEPKYPINWLKYIINGRPETYPYSQQHTNEMQYSGGNFIVPKNHLYPLYPNCVADFYNLATCPYLIHFRTFDNIICYMLIFSNDEDSSNQANNNIST